MIDKMQTYFGFQAMPFGRDLSPAMLHRHACHNEAAARITWAIGEKTFENEAGFLAALQQNPIPMGTHNPDPAADVPFEIVLLWFELHAVSHGLVPAKDPRKRKPGAPVPHVVFEFSLKGKGEQEGD